MSLAKFKLKSPQMIAYLVAALLTFLMGFMAIVAGGAAEQTEQLVGAPGKLHVYPLLIIFCQVFLYSLFFFLPGFSLTLAMYPNLPLLERVVFSFGVGALAYALNVGIWLVTGMLDFWVMSQIFWDIAFSFIVSFVGIILWLFRRE